MRPNPSKIVHSTPYVFGVPRGPRMAALCLCVRALCLRIAHRVDPGPPLAANHGLGEDVRCSSLPRIPKPSRVIGPAREYGELAACF